MTLRAPEISESQRLAILKRYGLLDTPAESEFDEIAAFAAQLCEAPAAFISLFDSAQEWFKASHGFSAQQWDRSNSLSVHLIEHGELICVPDVRTDERFQQNPHAIGEPYIRCFAAAPLISEEGAVLGAIGVFDQTAREITGSQQNALRVLAHQVNAQFELRRRRLDLENSRSRIDALLGSAVDAVVLLDQNCNIVEFNPAAEKIFGYSREGILGAPVAGTLISTELWQKQRAGLEEYLRAAGGWSLGGRIEITAIRADTSTFPAELTIVRNLGARPAEFVASFRDVSEKKRKDDARSKLALRNAALVLALGEIAYEYNVPEATVNWTGDFEPLLGWDSSEIDRVRDSWLEKVHPDDLPRLLEEVRGPKTFFCLEYRVRHKEGDYLWIQDRGAVSRDSVGDPLQVIGILCDVTARKQAEAKAREREEHLRKVLDTMFVFVGLFSTEGKLLDTNHAALRAGGLRREEVIGKKFEETPWWSHSGEVRAQVRRALERAAAGQTVREDFLVHVGRGRTILVDSTYVPLRNSEGEITEIVGSGVDVTSGREAQSALSESELRFRQLVESVREVFWMTDTSRRQVLYVSPRSEEIWGRPPEYLEAVPGAWMETVHPDDRARVESLFTRASSADECQEQYRIIRPDNSVRWVRDRSFPVKDSSGAVYRIIGVVEDITEHRRLEEQFRQSQKMEAIGQLASGVAHDFNNLLTVISGNASLLMMEDEVTASMKDSAQEIVEAAERGTTLTRQLLLFSRKQVMQPCKLDLNAIVGNMTKMLQRILGEDIALRSEFAPRLPLVEADAGMLEQILLNLAVNSRDAMPSGGRLEISTKSSFFTPEEYDEQQPLSGQPCVCLSVSDNGSGIPPDVLPRIFEPFFTTKEEGKGTGLGLATVYGIVMQHRGRISVESEPDKGTTFRISFPEVGGNLAEQPEEGESVKMPGGTETILLVEDEAALRSLSTHLLQLCGYTVHVASTGLAALEVWTQYKDRIQLLVTDVVMPDGMSGWELADIVHSERPELKVLYTSGYSPEVIGKDGPFVEGNNFLQKPYRVRQLAEAVRTCLDCKVG